MVIPRWGRSSSPPSPVGEPRRHEPPGISTSFMPTVFSIRRGRPLPCNLVLSRPSPAPQCGHFTRRPTRVEGTRDASPHRGHPIPRAPATPPAHTRPPAAAPPTPPPTPPPPPAAAAPTPATPHRT